MITTPDRLPLCVTTARAVGEDPIGTANRWDHAFAIALPLNCWDAFRDEAAWSDARRATMTRLAAHVKTTGMGFGLFLYDDGAGTTLGGGTRVTHYARPTGAFSTYAASTVVVDEPGLLALMEGALLRAEHAAPDAAPSEPNWHVCTHGRVDAACGKFGYPLYEALCADHRAWRTAHFGGHRFAPTVTELPAGRVWGYLDAEVARALATRTGDVARLRGHYRGWSALTPVEQVAEREAFLHTGWWWLDAPKAVATVAQGEGWADVTLRATHPDGHTVAFTARVTRTHTVHTRGKSASPDTTEMPQYACVIAEVGA